MKKLLTLLLAVGVIAAFAPNASALICTIDQKPAATLLVPYFQTSVTQDGDSVVPASGDAALDTLVTVLNASAAPVLAHVTVWNRRSVAVLDFNIALTGFDEISWSMGQVLTGNLPNSDATGGKNRCGTYSRFTPSAYPTSDDTSASTFYSNPVFNSSFALVLASELDGTNDCGGTADSLSEDPDTLVGYVTVDMVNYCTFANPDNVKYWSNKAGGFENCLWGDYIIATAGGIPTYGSPAIHIEATSQLNGEFGQWPYWRTFYARYWEYNGSNVSGDCNGGDSYFEGSDGLGLTGVCGSLYGDMREPLGVAYGARYLDSEGNTSYLRAWRASSGDPAPVGGRDLTDAGDCDGVEPNVLTVIWDEDEVPQQQTGCNVSPCPPGQHFNFPYETQRTGIEDFAGAQGHDGWVYVNFADPTTDSNVTALDQAWMGYDFESPAAFVNTGIDGVSFDVDNCNPVSLENGNGTFYPIPNPPNADGNTGSGDFF